MSGAHQMEPPCPLISWVNPFPRRFINRTTFFCNAWIAWMRLLPAVWSKTILLSFLHFHGLFPLLARETYSGTCSIYKSTREGLTPMVCMGDGGSIWWAPVLYDGGSWSEPRSHWWGRVLFHHSSSSYVIIILRTFQTVAWIWMENTSFFIFDFLVLPFYFFFLFSACF